MWKIMHNYFVEGFWPEFHARGRFMKYSMSGRVPEPRDGQKSQGHRYLVWFFFKTYLPTNRPTYLHFQSWALNSTFTNLDLNIMYDGYSNKSPFKYYLGIFWGVGSEAKRILPIQGGRGPRIWKIMLIKDLNTPLPQNEETVKNEDDLKSIDNLKIQGNQKNPPSCWNASTAKGLKPLQLLRSYHFSFLYFHLFGPYCHYYLCIL